MKLRVAVSGVLLAVTGLALSQAAPERPAPEIVQQMIRAFPVIKLAGTRIVEVREGPRLISNREFVLKDGRFLRTWFPAGSPREGEVVVEDGRTRRHFFPSDNRILITQIGKEFFGGNLARLVRRGPGFETKEGGEIAGRPTTLALMKDPRGNVRQKLWIDKRTFALLKREIYDEAGGRQGSFEFTQVDFSPTIRTGDFVIRKAGAQEITIQDLARLMGRQMRIEAKVLPPDLPDVGLRSVRILQLPRGQVLHQTYETPEGPVSLFQAPADANDMRIPPGAVRWRDGKGRYALVGPNQGQRLQRLARALGKPD